MKRRTNFLQRGVGTGRDLSLHTALGIAMILLLTACTTPKTVTRVITPPALLTQPVEKPDKPDPKTATQKDVAVYLVELVGALDLANMKLTLIRQWSEQWTQSIKPNN